MKCIGRKSYVNPHRMAEVINPIIATAGRELNPSGAAD